MPSDNQIPRGLQLFSPDAPPQYKQKRIIFVVIVFLATLGLIWPLYPLFSNIYPMIFNLPFSLGWLIILLFITMSALTWLYRSDNRKA